MKSITLVSLFASAALAAACGGGGSSGSPAAPGPAPAAGGTATFDAQHAWTNLLSTTRSWTVTGTGSDGFVYVLTLATEPGGTQVFPLTGVAASVSSFRNRLVREGSLQQEVLNEQFFDSEYRLLGSRVSADGGAADCSKTEVVAAIPLVGASVGATGPLYAATTYTDCTPGASQLGTSYHSWSVIGEAGLVYLCVSSSNKFIGETTERVSETCVQTDAAGNLGSQARIRLVLPGFSVTATN